VEQEWRQHKEAWHAAEKREREQSRSLTREQFAKDRDGPYLRVPTDREGYVWMGRSWWRDKAIALLLADRSAAEIERIGAALNATRRHLRAFPEILNFMLPRTKGRRASLSVMTALFVHGQSLDEVAAKLGYKHKRRRDRRARVRRALRSEVEGLCRVILPSATLD
jgi:hypothetical protein